MNNHFHSSGPGEQNVAQDDYAVALSHLEQSLAISQELGDKKQERMTLNRISYLHKNHGNYAGAVNYLEQSLIISREIGDKKQERTTLNHISCLHRKQGNYAAALSHLEQSLRISHEIGHRNQRVATLYTMLYLHGVQGDHPGFLRCRELIRQENGGNEAINFMDDIIWSAGGMRQAKHMLWQLEHSERILRAV